MTAIFEAWHLGDGNYPPLHKGQVVNLSFQIEPYSIELQDGGEKEQMVHLGGAEYRFSGRVLKVYCNTDDVVVVVRAGTFSFYINWLSKPAAPQEGNSLRGEGKLLLDHYLWAEYLTQYNDAPNLFFNFRVIGIHAVTIPESLIQRYEKGSSAPTSLRRQEYLEASVSDIEEMKTHAFDHGFYIVDFDDDGLEGRQITRTFGQPA